MFSKCSGVCVLFPCEIYCAFYPFTKTGDIDSRVKVGWGGLSLLIVESSVPQCSKMANC